MRILLALLLAILPAAAAAAPGTVYVLRHLHTPQGEQDPELTAEGRVAAGALARTIGTKPLTAIYVTAFPRSRQSAAPLAAARGLTPIVYDPADTPALVARVKAAAGPVLIVAHSNTVPDIVEQLGGARPKPIALTEFGDLWTVTARGATRTTLPSR